MRFSSLLLPASLHRRLLGLRARIPALAPAEKAALLALVSVLAAGALLRAWERSGVRLGPVDDWESLRALIVRSREDFARQGGGNVGGYPCAIDALPRSFEGASPGPEGDAPRILAAGTGTKGKKSEKSGGDKKAAPARPVDLNAASEKTLLALPGVGPSTAKAILARRAAQGKFRSVEDLLQVKGIGPKKLEALRPHVRVTSPASPGDSSDSAPP